MNKPKSITQLSKEQLEDLCLNLMHTDKVKTEMINQLETNRDEAIEYVKNTYDDVVSSFAEDKPMTNFKARKELLEILERGKE